MVKRIELDIQEKLLEEYDTAISKHFNTRAEAIRAAMRAQIKTLEKS